MRLNVKQICEYVGGSLAVEPLDMRAFAHAVKWDSREVESGDLFVALEGERHDGHGFIEDAITRGALAVLVDRPLAESTRVLAREMGAAIIEVSNTFAAVTDLAREWRTFLRGHVIGVTGSTGKTTTKDLISQVLSCQYSVVSTLGNQNNELGVPNTILSADPETEYVVVEMGMRGSGQITELCEFVRPEMGVITNIGDSHMELLKTRDAIARAKAELMECLPITTGTVFLNASDEYSDKMAEQAHDAEHNLNVVRFDGSGDITKHADVFVTNPHLDAQGKAHFVLHHNEKSCACSLKLHGYHNIFNAAAAAAVGLRVGMSLDACVQALEKAEPIAGRQKVERTRDGALVIDDSYNASPDSMRAALRTFKALEVANRRIAVLGDMGELGDCSQACHEDIGMYVANLNIDRLICIGDLSWDIARAAERANMPPDTIVHYDSIAEILADLEGSVEKGDAVLVKASHSVGLERVVRGLIS